MTGKHAYTNRLIHETSPYLHQHAHNPVDWYPWGEEAFARARAEDRPIFLSIGYATCHWCHTMEKESFEDANLGALMNETFINIKVDREELPQVDSLYMGVAQNMMGGLAGWPLNLVLTPNLQPVFAATYLPPQGQGGELGMKELIERIQALWVSDEREQLEEQAAELMASAEPTEGDGDLPNEVYAEEVAELYLRIADPIFGGIQGAPKFPLPYHLSFMLREAKRHEDGRSLYYVEKTLERMQRGGIYDHLGGGFARYAIDERWMTPHFEKMLYDNALLAIAYTEGWQASRNELFRAVAQDICDYVLRDMTDPEGGFYCAEDADSEGEEGRFYTWTYDEVIEALGDQEGRLFCSFYAITPQGTFHGRNVIVQEQTIAEYATEHRLHSIELAETLADGRRKLWKKREERVHPFKDDKVVVAWNGLMIRALAQAGVAFDEPRYIEAAKKAATFIRDELWQEGRLQRRWRRGEVGLAPCLEDYSCLIAGLLALFNATGEAGHLHWAVQLTHVLSADFKEQGQAFYRTDGSDPNMVVRQIELYDGAEPSGNAVHCENLLRLAQLTGVDRYLDEADDILRAAKPRIEENPLGATYHCLALQRMIDRKAPTLIFALVDGQEEILKALAPKFLPHAEIIWRREGDESLFELIPSLRSQGPVESHTTLYLCHHGACEAPIIGIPAIISTIETL